MQSLAVLERIPTARMFCRSSAAPRNYWGLLLLGGDRTASAPSFRIRVIEMTEQADVAPPGGSDDARAGGERATNEREQIAGQAESSLRKGGLLDDDLETRSHELARQYLRLGGRRRAVVDDNITDTRKWEPDEPEAEAFWQTQIASLPQAQRKQVEDHLPSVNQD